MPGEGLREADAAASSYGVSKDPAVAQCPIKAAQATEIVGRPGEFAKATGQRDRFRALAENTRFRLRLQDAGGGPRRGLPFLLEFRRRGGAAIESIRGQTDEDGLLDVSIPPDTDRGTITLKEDGEIREIGAQLGQLLPASQVPGAQRRLRNLDYYHGDDDGQLNAATARALTEFQLDYGLEPSGRLDADTAAHLACVHGS